MGWSCLPSFPPGLPARFSPPSAVSRPPGLRLTFKKVTRAEIRPARSTHPSKTSQAIQTRGLWPHSSPRQPRTPRNAKPGPGWADSRESGGWAWQLLARTNRIPLSDTSPPGTLIRGLLPSSPSVLLLQLPKQAPWARSEVSLLPNNNKTKPMLISKGEKRHKNNHLCLPSLAKELTAGGHRLAVVFLCELKGPSQGGSLPWALAGHT